MLLSKVAWTAILPATAVTRYWVARSPLRPSSRQGVGGTPGVENRPTQPRSDALRGVAIKRARRPPLSIPLFACRRRAIVCREAGREFAPWSLTFCSVSANVKQRAHIGSVELLTMRGVEGSGYEGEI